MNLTHDFWRRVNKRGPSIRKERCWAWTGSKNRQGRGQLRISKHEWINAPRISYMIHKGALEDHLYVLHRCDNPNCVNPAHLVKGTQQENVDQMISRGRWTSLKGSDHGRAKLTNEQVEYVRRVHKRWCPINGTKPLAKMFGVDPQIIQGIVNGNRY